VAAVALDKVAKGIAWLVLSPEGGGHLSAPRSDFLPGVVSFVWEPVGVNVGPAMYLEFSVYAGVIFWTVITAITVLRSDSRNWPMLVAMGLIFGQITGVAIDMFSFGYVPHYLALEFDHPLHGILGWIPERPVFVASTLYGWIGIGFLFVASFKRKALAREDAAALRPTPMNSHPDATP